MKVRIKVIKKGLNDFYFDVEAKRHFWGRWQSVLPALTKDRTTAERVAESIKSTKNNQEI